MPDDAENGLRSQVRGLLAERQIDSPTSGHMAARRFVSDSAG